LPPTEGNGTVAGARDACEHNGTAVDAILAPHAAQLDFCSEVAPYLPSECSCKELQYGFVAECSVNFFHVDTIGLKATFAPCGMPATASIDVTDTKFGIDYPIESISAGKNYDEPIPGLSLDIPDIGNVGVNLVIGLRGNPDNFTVKLGPDGCLEVSHYRVCGHKVTSELPIWLLDATMHFSDVCPNNPRRSARPPWPASNHPAS